MEVFGIGSSGWPVAPGSGSSSVRSARAVAARLYRRRGGCCCRALLGSGLPWPAVALFTSNPTGTTSIFGQLGRV